MLVIGLTGGIASGKSTISDYLRKMGAVIIDADILSRQVVEPGEEAWRKIWRYFGSQAFNDDKTINRKKLAEIVFSDPEKRQILNEIVHPEVIKKTKLLIAQYKEEGLAPLIVVDAPLLIEAGIDKMVDEVWVISVEEELQIKRLIARDNIPKGAALKRLESQMPMEEKLKYASRVIDNNQDLTHTIHQIKEIWRQVLETECKHEVQHNMD
ncbi:MAG: dephospho-CoA kinase [Peptococcaceae bacterium BICA1-8]|nr:MAG: dephospho-CoA kinase [Peptococcaceae bacterium BICA1-8]